MFSFSNNKLLCPTHTEQLFHSMYIFSCLQPRQFFTLAFLWPGRSTSCTECLYAAVSSTRIRSLDIGVRPRSCEVRVRFGGAYSGIGIVGPAKQLFVLGLVSFQSGYKTFIVCL